MKIIGKKSNEPEQNKCRNSLNWFFSEKNDCLAVHKKRLDILTDFIAGIKMETIPGNVKYLLSGIINSLHPTKNNCKKEFDRKSFPGKSNL